MQHLNVRFAELLQQSCQLLVLRFKLSVKANECAWGHSNDGLLIWTDQSRKSKILP